MKDEFVKKIVKKYVYKKRYKNGKSKTGKPLYRNKKIVKKIIYKPKKNKRIVNLQKKLAEQLTRSGANTREIESFLKQTMKKLFIPHETIKKIVKKNRKNRIQYRPSQRKYNYKDTLKSLRQAAGDIFAYKQLKRDVNANYLASYLAKSIHMYFKDNEITDVKEAYIKPKYYDAVEKTLDMLSPEGY